MCKCKTLTDRLEDILDKAVADEDWPTASFLQDLLAVVLVHPEPVAEAALARLVARGCACKEAS